MANAFRRVRVEPNVSPILGCGTYIEWFMDPRFNEPGPWTFYVERAKEVNGHYTVVATTENQPYAYDETIDQSDKIGDVSWWYRIRVGTANNKYFLSEQISAGDTWDKRDWLVANRIIKKELLLLQKRSGQQGVLLKRRNWGVPCPRCLDPATGEATDSHCPVCFGTAFEGGYYAPLTYWVSTEPNEFSVSVKQLGAEADARETARGLASPPPAPNDIFIKDKTGQCYRIESQIKTVAHIRGNPIVYQFGLGLIQSSDIIYSYVLPNALPNKEVNRTNARTT